jgi:hypothetical protein
MKKQILTLSTALLVCASIVLTGCKKDEEAPVITLNGNAEDKSALNADYSDPGAKAVDNEDGDLTSSITSDASTAVVKTSAETYTVTYKCTDKAGNEGTATRQVNVVIGQDNMVGTYDVTDKVGSGSPFLYQDGVTKSATANRIIVSKFAYYTNGGVYFDISGTNGTTLTIPDQTVVCGLPSATRTFSGSGTISKDGKIMTLNYTEVTNGTTVTGVETYTKK